MTFREGSASYLRLVSLAAAALLLGASAAKSNPLALATSSINLSAGQFSGDNLEFFDATGPLAESLHSDGGIAGFGWSADSAASANFLNLGSASMSASAEAHGLFSRGAAGAGALVRIPFDIRQTGTPPFQLVQIPILFTANGGGSLSGSGPDWLAGFNVFAELLATGGGGFSLECDSSTNALTCQHTGNTVSGGTSGLSATASWADTFNLLLGGGNNYIFVGGGADVAPFADSSAEAAAIIDPTIAFDQAAFDLAFGSQAFLLADFFTIDFSPNITEGPTPPPVPEPSSLVILGTALAALGLGSWRRSLSRLS